MSTRRPGSRAGGSRRGRGGSPRSACPSRIGSGDGGSRRGPVVDRVATVVESSGVRRVGDAGRSLSRVERSGTPHRAGDDQTPAPALRTQSGPRRWTAAARPAVATLTADDEATISASRSSPIANNQRIREITRPRRAVPIDNSRPYAPATKAQQNRTPTNSRPPQARSHASATADGGVLICSATSLTTSITANCSSSGWPTRLTRAESTVVVSR